MHNMHKCCPELSMHYMKSKYFLKKFLKKKRKYLKLINVRIHIILKYKIKKRKYKSEILKQNNK